MRRTQWRLGRVMCALSACFLGAVLIRAIVLGRAPRAECEAPVFNFGDMDTGHVVRHEFVIRNSGATTLHLRSVRSSCGCAVAKLTPANIAPGSTSSVLVTLSLERRRGRVAEHVALQTNDRTTPWLVLRMEGNAAAVIEARPAHASFGRIAQGAGGSGAWISYLVAPDSSSGSFGLSRSCPMLQYLMSPARKRRIIGCKSI